MPKYKYLIIGGGMTGDAAAKGIRKVDANGAIGMIGAEPHRPYDRPPLSKGLWKDTPQEKIWRRQPGGVDLHAGRKVQVIDPVKKQVIDDQGATYSYDKLLLATGGTPRRFSFGDGRIIYYRTFDDYQRLRKLADERRRFVVIGGGFIGSEIAAALAMNGKEVVLAFPGDGIGDRVFPRDLSQFLNGYYQKKGVEVLARESVAGCEARGDQAAIKIRNRDSSAEREIVADGVVAGIGIEPNVELAQGAGLEVGNGILVNEFLQTSHREIFAAGDVAAFHSPLLGRRIRVEHEDNANNMGRAAGRAIAGQAEPYKHLPFFYSDLFELGYEAVGEIDPRLEAVADWKTPQQEGVVYYLRNGRVRGVLLWNVWGQVDAARSLIAEPGPFRSEDLKGRLLKAA